MSGVSAAAVTARRIPLTSNSMDVVKVQSSQGRLRLPLLVRPTPTSSWDCEPALLVLEAQLPRRALSEELRENRCQTSRSLPSRSLPSPSLPSRRLPRTEHTSGCHLYTRH